MDSRFPWGAGGGAKPAFERSVLGQSREDSTPKPVIAKAGAVPSSPGSQLVQLDSEVKARVDIDVKKEQSVLRIKADVTTELANKEKEFKGECGKIEQQFSMEKGAIEKKLREVEGQMQFLKTETEKLNVASKLVAEGDLAQLQTELENEQRRFMQEFDQIQDTLIGPVNNALGEMMNYFGQAEAEAERTRNQIIERLERGS